MNDTVDYKNYYREIISLLRHILIPQELHTLYELHEDEANVPLCGIEVAQENLEEFFYSEQLMIEGSRLLPGKLERLAEEHLGEVSPRISQFINDLRAHVQETLNDRKAAPVVAQELSLQP